MFHLVLKQFIIFTNCLLGEGRRGVFFNIFFLPVLTLKPWINSKYYSFIISANHLMYPVILSIYPVILSIYPVILFIYPVILSIYQVILSIYPVILSIYPVMLSIYPVILSIYAVILSIYPVILSIYPVIFIFEKPIFLFVSNKREISLCILHIFVNIIINI